MALSRGGRPQKFGEPTIVRQFRLPESLNGRLTKRAREEGLDVSDIVRTAIDVFLSQQDQTKPEKEGEKQDLEGLRTLIESLLLERAKSELWSEVKFLAVMRQVVREEVDDALVKTLGLPVTIGGEAEEGEQQLKRSLKEAHQTGEKSAPFHQTGSQPEVAPETHQTISYLRPEVGEVTAQELIDVIEGNPTARTLELLEKQEAKRRERETQKPRVQAAWQIDNDVNEALFRLETFDPALATDDEKGRAYLTYMLAQLRTDEVRKDVGRFKNLLHRKTMSDEVSPQIKDVADSLGNSDWFSPKPLVLTQALAASNATLEEVHELRRVLLSEIEFDVSRNGKGEEKADSWVRKEIANLLLNPEQAPPLVLAMYEQTKAARAYRRECRQAYERAQVQAYLQRRSTSQPDENGDTEKLKE